MSIVLTETFGELESNARSTLQLISCIFPYWIVIDLQSSDFLILVGSDGDELRFGKDKDIDVVQ